MDIEEFKKRHIRQNKEVIRINSMQSCRIRELEEENKRLMGELFQLQKQNSRLSIRQNDRPNTEAIDCWKHDIEIKLCDLLKQVREFGIADKSNERRHFINIRKNRRSTFFGSSSPMNRSPRISPELSSPETLNSPSLSPLLPEAPLSKPPTIVLDSEKAPSRQEETESNVLKQKSNSSLAYNNGKPKEESRRSGRARKDINYTLPSLRTKVRREDGFKEDDMDSQLLSGGVRRKSTNVLQS